jgi:pyruvate/2-oxoglutarate dehydrogenase complex dihydrolipoamide acyltransferase (E2) component
MPHEVIMPALGMAQDTGQILAWHKKPGEAVSAGDVLFEVETDKAAMEVEAPKPGYLTDVTAEAGSDVPVGQVIALISETPDGKGGTREPAVETQTPATSDEPAEISGHDVIMPTLGMAQDTGLLVRWLKQPGDQVAADDVLFEVETDKSTMEVNAGHDGHVAALLAKAGEDVPVGQVIAVISADKSKAPVSRKAGAGAAPTTPPGTSVPSADADLAPAGKPAASTLPPTGTNGKAGGRILASPKARRLARDLGLDLGRLAQAGYAQPFHVKDLETLKAMPEKTASSAVSGTARRLTADISEDGFESFAAWAVGAAGLKDKAALLAGLAGASLERFPLMVAVEENGSSLVYAVSSSLLGQVTKAEEVSEPDLRVRDLRSSRITSLKLGAEACPVLSVARSGGVLALTLECAADQLSADDALTLLSNFAGRMEQPLRHLL